VRHAHAHTDNTSETPFLFIFRELRYSRKSLDAFKVNNIRPLRRVDIEITSRTISRVREERRETNLRYCRTLAKVAGVKRMARNHRAQISAVILKRE